MKHLLPLILVTLISFSGKSQNYYKKFLSQCKTGDTLGQLETLTKWEAADPKEAELYTSYFNYYFRKSKQEMVELTTERPEGEYLELTDSANQTAGYMGSKIYYSEAEFQKGITWIDRGIELYPDRLDMRFGKIYAYSQKQEWTNFTDEIIVTIKYSNRNKNNWTWTNNVKKDEGEKFFLTSLQDYQLTLYNTGRDDLLINMRDIADEILTYYPNHIESLTNLSITYLLTGEYDKGLEALSRAELLNPRDYVVLSNIAHCYKLKGDKEKAIEYYEKTFEYGDEHAKAFAKQQIEELKK